MKNIWKSLKKFVKNFLKDKWNIAIAVLILLVAILGITIVGIVKTLTVIGIVVALVLAIRYGGIYIMSKRGKTTSKERSHKKGWKKLVSSIIIIILCLSIIGVIAGICFMGYVVMSAPKFEKEKLYYKEASIIYDVDGNEVTRIGDEMRDKVTYDEIPQVFVDAIVATEDSRYFEHNGFDLPRFLKASVGQVLGNSGAGGASTISMQVIKNNFTSVNQSIMRKFTDIYLSVFKLEKAYTKEQILEFYVNDIHLGVNNTLGIAETARALFGKEIGDINLSEAALLAGMFQAPGAYNPYRYPEKAAARRSTVLYLMERHGYITNEERVIANNIPIESLVVNKESVQHPYQGYIDYVSEEVIDKTGYDPMEVPMKIYTNLDVDKQDFINGIMDGTNYQWVNDVIQAGVAVTNVNTGAIVALGNGRNRNAQKLFSFATDIKRQVGSTAKPLFDYGPGMEYNNWSTYTPFVDDVYSYSDGKAINNWDNKYNGMLTLKYSLAQSRNIPALKAFQQVDNKKIIEFVEALGITPEIDSGRIHEAHSIGGFNGASPLQLAAAYAAFSNGGYYIKPYAVNKVEIMDTGKTATYKPEKVKVMSDSTAYMITNVLKFGVDSKLIGGGRVKSGLEVAAKSGTSNFDQATKSRYKMSDDAINDLWYASYSPEYAFGLWYGYETANSTYYSKSTPASIARDKLFAAIANGIFEKNGKTFTMPSSVVSVEIENGTIPAMLPSSHTPSGMRITEVFKKGTEPTEVSPRFNTLSNVGSLDVNKDGSSVKLTWKAVSAPDMMTGEYLATIAAQKDKYINIRKNEDANILGVLGYNVYLKKDSGELSLLGWTANTSFTHTPSTSGSLTYVVKTCYSIFKNSESTGTTTTLSNSPYVPVIEIYMTGDPIVNVTQGTTYKDAGVTVLENMFNVTDKATVVTVITKKTTNEVVTSIDTSVKITYEIKYTVTYKGDTQIFVRTVNIV